MLDVKKGAPKGNKNATKNAKDLKKTRSIKISDSDWEAIQAKAQQVGMTAGAYMRDRALSD